MDNQTFEIKIGGCTDCTNCGLCNKGKLNPDVVTETSDKSKQYDFSGIEEGKDERIVAVDLGTTTIAMFLIDASSGEQLGVFTSLNPQREFGADVISRISAAEAGKAEEMRSSIRECILNGVEQVSKGCKPKLIVISGNTVMVHLFLGWSTDSLGKYPFTPVSTEAVIDILGGIKTFIMPGISAFAGGDTVSGIFTGKMHKNKEITMLIDLGTNAEMAVGNKDRILVTSAAAGPAFDMKVYGANLIKAVAGLLDKRIIDETGCLQDEYFEQGADFEGIHVTNGEIRSLQSAKAAVACAVEMMLSKYGCGYEDVSKVYLAGGLAFYLDLDSAFRIGLLPEQFKGKAEICGNTSLEGACKVAEGMSKDIDALDSELKSIVALSEYFDLAAEDKFNEEYINHMNFS